MTTSTPIRWAAGPVLAAVLMAALAACGEETSDTTGPTESTTATESASPTEPTESSTSPGGADRYEKIAGTWRSTNGEWVLHLEADRTFTQDFAGAEQMRSGTYRLDGNKFRLKGGHGDIDRGTYNGKRIRIRDYVFKRAK